MTKNDAVERADPIQKAIAALQNAVETFDILHPRVDDKDAWQKTKWLDAIEALQTSRPVTYGGTADDHVCRHDSGTSAVPPIKGVIGAAQSGASRLGDLGKALTLSSESRVQTSRPDVDRLAALDAFEFIQHDYIGMLSECDLSENESLKAEGCLKTIRAALQSGDKGQQDDRAQLIKIIEAQKDYLKAYKDGKYAMYSMSEEIRDAVIKHLPCGEGPLDRAVRNVLPPTSEGV